MSVGLVKASEIVSESSLREVAHSINFSLKSGLLELVKAGGLLRSAKNFFLEKDAIEKFDLWLFESKIDLDEREVNSYIRIYEFYVRNDSWLSQHTDRLDYSKLSLMARSTFDEDKVEKAKKLFQRDEKITTEDLRLLNKGKRVPKKPKSEEGKKISSVKKTLEGSKTKVKDLLFCDTLTVKNKNDLKKIRDLCDEISSDIDECLEE